MALKPTATTQQLLNAVIAQLTSRCQIYEKVSGHLVTPTEATMLLFNVADTIGNPRIRHFVRKCFAGIDRSPSGDIRVTLRVSDPTLKTLNSETKKIASSGF